MIFQKTFGALRHPNYRLWFFSQLLSFFGTWMQNAAQGYLLFELTQSYVWLGYLAIATGIPSIGLMMYGGALSDRHPKRTIIMIAEAGMMVISLGVGVLILVGHIQPWHLLISAFLMGVCNAFDVPARQAIVADLVGREDLPNAVALGAALFNAAVALGPAFGGVIYAAIGPSWCFIINGASFSGILIALWTMRSLPGPQPQAAATKPFQAILKALRTIGESASMRTVILSMGNGVLLGMSLYSLLPAWSVDVLHGDSRTNGLLYSLRGIGALAAALTLATLGRSRFKPHILVAASFAFPVVLALFGLANSPAFSLAVIAVAGFCQIALFNNANAVTQLSAPPDQRGAVMGVYNFVFNGASPLGGFIAGALAHAVGLVGTWEIFAGVALAMSISIFLTDRQFVSRAI